MGVLHHKKSWGGHELRFIRDRLAPDTNQVSASNNNTTPTAQFRSTIICFLFPLFCKTAGTGSCTMDKSPKEARDGIGIPVLQSMALSFGTSGLRQHEALAGSRECLSYWHSDGRIPMVT